MQFPPPRRLAARGGTQSRAAPPSPRLLPTDLDPVPFPGGAEAALEFAAFEKGLLERGSGNGGSARSREPVPIAPRTPLSGPDRHSICWMLAGASLATVAALLLLLLSSGLLTAGFAAVLRAIIRP